MEARRNKTAFIALGRTSMAPKTCLFITVSWWIVRCWTLFAAPLSLMNRFVAKFNGEYFWLVLTFTPSECILSLHVSLEYHGVLNSSAIPVKTLQMSWIPGLRAASFKNNDTGKKLLLNTVRMLPFLLIWFALLQLHIFHYRLLMLSITWYLTWITGINRSGGKTCECHAVCRVWEGLHLRAIVSLLFFGWFAFHRLRS